MESNGIIKSGFVAIIGLPNAGKSSFLNAVIKENIAITSRKPQTTRKNLKGIYNDEESQIIFVDTPGIHETKNKLDEFMNVSIKKAVDEIDAIIVIVDIMTYKDDNYKKLNSMLQKNNTKKILLINKCDLIEFDETNTLDDIQHKFAEDITFDKVFFISALKNKSIKDVISYLKTILPIGNRYYDGEYLTDEPTKQIVADIVRQHCLYKLEKEVPHGVTVVVDSLKKAKSKCLNIDATIVCDKQNHKGIIIGNKGSMIKNIGTGSRIALEKSLNSKVNLKLNVIVKENWKDERTLLINYGYDKDSI